MAAKIIKKRRKNKGNSAWKRRRSKKVSTKSATLCRRCGQHTITEKGQCPCGKSKRRRLGRPGKDIGIGGWNFPWAA